ncbi:MAG: hypothetical protein IPK26_22495 [Planctomycetes bacterium]|nr:hypothetical protein [Planctomycetota bacterium]
MVDRVPVRLLADRHRPARPEAEREAQPAAVRGLPGTSSSTGAATGVDARTIGPPAGGHTASFSAASFRTCTRRHPAFAPDAAQQSSADSDRAPGHTDATKLPGTDRHPANARRRAAQFSAQQSTSGRRHADAGRPFEPQSVVTGSDRRRHHPDAA